MTDAPTRVAEQRCHYGVPGAAVAVMAPAETLLPGLAVAQDVYLRAGLDLSRPVGLLQGNRAVERAFAEGRGPHPASWDISSNSNTLGTGSNDP